MKIVATYDLCMWLVHKGVEKFDPMNTGGTTEQGGFTVSLVRAEHSSAHLENGVSHALGNPCGVIVKAQGEPTVYHMGDTDIFGHGSDRRDPRAASHNDSDRRPLHDEIRRRPRSR